MSRIRTMKPELLDDERVARLSHGAFRLFLGTLLLADDYGNLRGALDFLAGRIFHSQPLPELAAALQELVSAGLVRPYLVRAQAFLTIVNWSKHQRIIRPAKPHIPGPVDADTSAPLDPRWTWRSAPLPQPAAPPQPQPQEQHGQQREEEVPPGLRARADGPSEGPGAAPAEHPGDAAERPGADMPVHSGGDQGRPTAAPDLPATPALNSLEALRIVAKAAGARLVLHPPGRPYPSETGAAPAAELDFARAWMPLREVWTADHLRQLGEGLASRTLWRHLRGGVSLRYLTEHLEEGLQQAAVPAQAPEPPRVAASVAPERPRLKEWRREDAAPPADPARVKGDLGKGVALLQSLGVTVPKAALRVVRDEEQQLGAEAI